MDKIHYKDHNLKKAIIYLFFYLLPQKTGTQNLPRSQKRLYIKDYSQSSSMFKAASLLIQPETCIIKYDKLRQRF